MTEDQLVQWTGTATFKDAIHRITIIARPGCWKADAVAAAKSVGAYPQNLEEAPAPKGEEAGLMNATKNVYFAIILTPDSRLAARKVGLKRTEFHLTKSRRIIRDGEFQRAPTSLTRRTPISQPPPRRKLVP